MMYLTHLLLADALLPAIEETWGVTLSRKRFRSGSVKPDASTLFVRHPHFWRHSRKFAVRKIARLARGRLKPDSKNGRFSEDLGIALHYVADFFTSAHNVRPNRLKAHLESEARLHEAFARLVSADSARTSMRLILGTGARRLSETDDGEDDSRERIGRVLKELHGRFAPALDDPVSDIREILVACLTVTALVMDAATAKRHRRQAGQTGMVQKEKLIAAVPREARRL
jgi:hypothetical protein